MTVEIGGDSTKLGKALDESKKKSKSLQTELKQVDKLLKLDPTNVELMGQKQKILGEQVEETKKRLSLLRDEQSKVNELFSSGEIGAEEYRKYQREVEQTRIELESLETQYSETMQSVNGVDLSTAKGKVGNFKDSITDLSNASKAKMDELANNLNAVGNKIESVGTTISTTVSSAATKVLSNSVEAFEDLDEGYDIIVKKTGATDDKLESLKKDSAALQKLYLPNLVKSLAQVDPENTRLFNQRLAEFHPRMVLNMIDDPKDADRAQRIRHSCKQFLEIGVECC